MNFILGVLLIFVVYVFKFKDDLGIEQDSTKNTLAGLTGIIVIIVIVKILISM